MHPLVTKRDPARRSRKAGAGRKVGRSRASGLLAALLLVGVFGSGWTGPGQAGAVAPATDNLITDTRLRGDEGLLEAQLQQFLDGQPGPLKTYSEALYAGSTQTAARSIAAYSQTAEINPRVVLALLELKSRLLSNPAPAPGTIEAALGFAKPEQRGFRRQLNLATGLLSDRWSSFEKGSTVQFKDGTTRPVNPAINRATYAVQATLALTTSPETWEAQISRQPGSFYDIYKRLWGDPLAPDPRPGPPLETESPAPFLARPFYEWDLQGAGLVSGRGIRLRSQNPGGLLPASDGLDYNSAMDYGVNTYFDHLYPFDTGSTLTNSADNEFPGLVVTYRGRQSPHTLGAERAYSGHNAIDFDLTAGKAVLAAASGRVVSADWGNCGKAVMIDHRNGYRTLYMHLDTALNVAAGQEVAQGQPVGAVGRFSCTVPHLHFGVLRNSQPVDPFGFCPDQVKADPWEAKSGARSYWLWQTAASPCTQQHPSPGEIRLRLATQDFNLLTRGRSGAAVAGVIPDDLETIIPAGPSVPASLREQATVTARAWLHSDDTLLRRSAIDSLVQAAGAGAIPELLKLLADPDDSVRWTTIQALVRLGGQKQAAAACLELMSSPDPQVRQRAIRTLSELKTRQAVPRLIEALHDQDNQVRRQAIDSLADFEATEAIPHLANLLTDNNLPVRRSAAETLSRLMGQTALPYSLENTAPDRR